MSDPCGCGDEARPDWQHVVGGHCYPIDYMRLDIAPVTDRTPVPPRVEALRHAKDLLAYLDHGADDLIVVADWLVTGRADVALAMSEQRFRHYQETQNGDGLGPDAMRWTPSSAPTGGLPDVDD